MGLTARPELGGDRPSAALRASVLDEALSRRPPGRPAGTVTASPVETYRRATAELAALLAELSSSDWSSPVPAYRDLGWTVQDLVAHLGAVERYCCARLGAAIFEPPPGTETDHIAMTLPAVDAHRGRPPSATRADWSAAAAGVLASLEDRSPDLERRIGFHGVPFRLSSLLVARAFELWIHGDDIRDATSRPRSTPDASALTLMTDLAVRSTRTGLAVDGCDLTTRSIRIVLTGPGGGAWSLGADRSAGEHSVRIVADAEAFCRLAARRLGPDALGAHIDGDGELGAEVLAAAAAFAA